MFPRKLLKVRLLKVRYQNSVVYMLNVLFLLCFILCLLVFETGSPYYVAVAVLELTTLGLAGIELTEFNVLTPKCHHI